MPLMCSSVDYRISELEHMPIETYKTEIQREK